MNMVIAFLSGTGIFNSLFFIIYLNFFSKRDMNLPSKKLLSLLIFVVSIKMGFLLAMDLTEAYPKIQYGYFLISLVSYTAIGPVFYLYVKSMTNRKIMPLSLIHFLPPVFLLIFFDYPTYVESNGINYIQAYFCCYLTFSGYQIWRYYSTEDQWDRRSTKWLIVVNLILFIVWLTAVSEMYKVELLALYSFLLYPAMMFTKNLDTFKKKAKSKNGLNGEELNLMNKISSYMVAEKPYLNPNLIMPELAKELHVQPHVLSATINNQLNKNFPDFINEYRVKAAAQKLKDKTFQHLTISSIAYDVGFNSLSTFNKSFKKIFKMTPSIYRKNHI